MSNIVVPPKKLSIYELVSQMGMVIGDHPHLFTDCFSYNGMSQESIKLFKNSCGGISAVLKNIIPAQIDGKYSHSNDLIMAIVEHKKFIESPSIIKYQDIVSKSIGKVVGFLIVKKHKECLLDERLMKMREVVKAAQNMTRVSAIGAHKGPRMIEVMEANQQYASSQNCDILSKDVTNAIREYLEMQMYEKNDQVAFRIRQLMHLDSKKLLPPPKD